MKRQRTEMQKFVTALAVAGIALAASFVMMALIGVVEMIKIMVQ